MAKQTKSLANIPDIVEMAWLSKKFDELHTDHLLIIKKLDDLKNVVPEFVSPELQAAIIQTAKLALGIDMKVPDK